MEGSYQGLVGVLRCKAQQALEPACCDIRPLLHLHLCFDVVLKILAWPYSTLELRSQIVPIS